MLHELNFFFEANSQSFLLKRHLYRDEGKVSWVAYLNMAAGPES